MSFRFQDTSFNDPDLYDNQYDSINELEQPQKQYCKCCCQQLRCTSRKNCLFAIFAVCVFFIGGMAAVTEWVVFPDLAQSLINDSTMDFTHMAILGAEGNAVGLTATCVLALSTTPPIGGRVHAFTATMFYNGQYCKQPLGCELGTFEAPEIQLASGQRRQSFEINTNLMVSNSTHFGYFGTDLVQLPAVLWSIQAKIEVSSSVAGLPLDTKGVTVNKQFKLDGYNGFPGAFVNGFEIYEDNTTHILRVSVNASLPIANSRLIVQDMGDLYMSIVYKGAVMGSANIYNVSLLPGTNTFAISGELHPANQTLFDDFITNYIMCRPVQMLLAAPPRPANASSIPLFEPIARAITLKAKLPVLAFPLGMQVEMTMNWNTIFEFLLHGKIEVPVRLMMHNPIGAAIRFRELDFFVDYNGTRLGRANDTVSFTLPPYSTAWSASTTALIDWTQEPQLKDEIKAFLEILQDGMTIVGISGGFTADVGHLTIVPDYFQPENIPACIDTESKCDNYTALHPTWPLCPTLCSHDKCC